MTDRSEAVILAPYQPLVDGHLDFHGASAVDPLDPIAVGAVGGSGTRLLFQVLADCGVAMATALNQAGDALGWPPYHALLSPANLARYSRATILRNTFHVFESLLRQRREELGGLARTGWKVPGTFHWLTELSEFFPRMQYVHLIRNGLDMAYTRNQYQIGNWAGDLGVEVRRGPGGAALPGSMLDYWLAANELALRVGRDRLGDRFLLVRYENLCRAPRAELERLTAALNLPASTRQLDRLAERVETPPSLGRHRRFDWRSDFNDCQLQRLERLGYQP